MSVREDNSGLTSDSLTKKSALAGSSFHCLGRPRKNFFDFVGGPVRTKRRHRATVCFGAFSHQLQGLVQVLLGSVELHGLQIEHLSRLSPQLHGPIHGSLRRHHRRICVAHFRCLPPTVCPFIHCTLLIGHLLLLLCTHSVKILSCLSGSFSRLLACSAPESSFAPCSCAAPALNRLQVGTS